MIRNLKMLGLALVAVFAMSSLVASAASAANDAFLADSAPVTLTGAQENANKFNLAGQSVECTTAKVNATVASKTVTEVTTEQPSYSGCTYAGQGATVSMNNCRYILTGTTDTSGDALAKVDCPAGKVIELTLNSIGCIITVATQNAEEGYTITTVGSGATKELTLHITAKVSVTSDKDPTEGVTCASLTKGTGTLEGTFLITGEEDKAVGAAHVGITDETL